ncbi:MAG: molybdopterin-guanine dinucleotide biosynthesis protein MobB [Candidatus Cloacimonetes bacterium]|nr:molybdopterin-guanine dinucleotide biosynthesis protein MobB [Candidatus Cloacimonadota bacterium]
MKVFSVIGLHRSGKTTAVENLIKYFKNNGLSVSSIKDIHQENFTMEKEGSNSQRHLRASNTCVFARGSEETYLIWNRQLRLKEMLSHINTEWLVIEGMNKEALPKIIAAKNINEVEDLFDDKVFAITGEYSEQANDYKGIPIINAINDTDRLGDLVINKVFEVLPFANEGFCGHCGFNCSEMTNMILKGEKSRDACGMKKSQKISVNFNGAEIALNEWVEKLSIDVIQALCKNLKGYKASDEIVIRIKN